MNSVANPQSKSGMAVAAKWTYAVLAVALLFILMPFLFWRATWFGRPMTAAELSVALSDTGHPRNIQHGLSQISDRIVRGDPEVKQFYPQVVALASNSHEEIRRMDAWVMGGDNSSPEFHQALLQLLRDPDTLVERNAALGLVRFHDARGHDVIAAMLKPSILTAPSEGNLKTQAKEGDSVSPGAEIGTVQSGKVKQPVTAEMDGRIGRWLVSDGATVTAGQSVVAIVPSDDTVWEALRALYLIGKPEDLDAISAYARGGDEAEARIAQQARLTMEEIRSRASSEPATPGAPR